MKPNKQKRLKKRKVNCSDLNAIFVGSRSRFGEILAMVPADVWAARPSAQIHTKRPAHIAIKKTTYLPSTKLRNALAVGTKMMTRKSQQNASEITYKLSTFP